VNDLKSDNNAKDNQISELETIKAFNEDKVDELEEKN